MSEYWISPPHFGTMGKSSATVVHTPRNVDLPSHVVLEDSNGQKQRKRKCLCLSFWMLGLVMLTAGAIVVAHFLIPEPSATLPQKARENSPIVQSCQDVLPLEDKVKNTDLIVVGSVMPDMTLKVIKIIKGSSLHRPKLPESGKSCFESTHAKQVFFLASERQGRSVAKSNFDQIYVPKYPALRATPKIVEIVEKLVVDTSVSEEQPFMVKPVHESSIAVTEGRSRFRFKFKYYES